MPVIASISGIRGTLGGRDGLSPLEIARYAAAFGAWLARLGGAPRVVIGRDARASGPLVQDVAAATLCAMGYDVIDLGPCTTPTVAVAAMRENARGAIVVSASHNPDNWNALKLMNGRGEFLNADEAADLLELYRAGDFDFAPVARLGARYVNTTHTDRHIEAILALPPVDAAAVAARDFTVVVDGCSSVGGPAMLQLLRALGVGRIVELDCAPDGRFKRNPEPLAENLEPLCLKVQATRADLGLALDPDGDRLALVDERGVYMGEEYTQALVMDYWLSLSPGPAVTNLSSSRVTRDVAAGYRVQHYTSPVGEAHVVAKMKKVGAVIGGEGNGGVIVPELHYGRDGLVGAALILSGMARKGKTASEWRAELPEYVMVKDKLTTPAGLNILQALSRIPERFPNAEIDTQDGLKLDLPKGWAHIRPSNTEPIIRVYAEGADEIAARALADAVKAAFSDIIAANPTLIAR